MSGPRLKEDEHGTVRCWWSGGAQDYVAYHDDEWAVPMADDVRLFEKICLEGFQAGLSWITILRKRENFRRAFAGFDIEKVARFNTRSVDRLLGDAGIVRHRGKIESTINNARRALELTEEYGSLAAFFWEYEPPRKFAGVPAITDESRALSKELKRRGWSFVGPTTAYAFMQAMGLVNDHLPGCFARDRIESARKRFKPPLPKKRG
jgi:DNA-3-methyladenine glycosylase I